MKIIVHSEEELMQLAVDAIHILHNLRRTTEDWRLHYGSHRLSRVKYFEEKADDLFRRLHVKEANKDNPIKIEVKDEEV